MRDKAALRLLFLQSSHRKSGNTASILGLLDERLKELSSPRALLYESETIFLADEELKPCRGCRTCFDRGEELCPLKDGLLRIRERMGEADIVVAGSPVYVEDVNGTMKTLIDRLAFLCHRPAFHGKAFYALTSSGSGSTPHALRTLSTAFRLWGFSVIGGQSFIAGALSSKAELERKYALRLTKAAARILRFHVEERALRPSFLSLLSFGIQQLYYRRQAAEDSLDLRYWKDRAWLDAGRTHYGDRRAGFLKVALARLLGRLIAAIVLK